MERVQSVRPGCPEGFLLYNVVMDTQPSARTNALSRQEGSGLKSVTRDTLAQSVYTQLKSAIISGRLRDGAELKQVELAAQLGVSRVPVREALRRLQAEHLVVAEPFQCFVVTSLTADQVVELCDIREELEALALKKSASSEARLERAQAAAIAAESLSLEQDGENWLEADRAFHRALNGPTTAVASIIEEIRERLHRYMYSSVADLERRRAVLREHAALVDALKAGDERELERVVRLHVRGTRESVERDTAEMASVGQQATS